MNDDQVVTLRAGDDVLGQRGTIHNSINGSNAPCAVAFVPIDARPVEQAGKVPKAHG